MIWLVAWGIVVVRDVLWFATITREQKWALDYVRVATAHQVVKVMVPTRLSATHAQYVSHLL